MVGSSVAAASRTLADLASLGILERQEGKRGQLFFAVEAAKARLFG